MGVTLNKDGTPRKIGSGKTKGAGCYEKITLRELRKLVNENAEVSGKALSMSSPTSCILACSNSRAAPERFLVRACSVLIT